MPNNWERIAEAEDLYKDVNDFKQSAYQLITEQVLYEASHAQRKAFHIIQKHMGHFKDAVGLFGLELFVNHSYRYCYVVPRDVRQVPLSLEETLLILVLRQLYHERASKGDQEADGRVTVEIEELKQAFKGATGRELPVGAGELKEKVQGLRRYGIARTVDVEPGSIQPFDICILAGIEELVNENAVSRLGAYLVATAPLDGSSEEKKDALDETA